MENTFNLKKFLVENKLTKNSRILSEIEQSVEIANNLKKIKSTAEAVLVNAKRALEDEETYAGIDREGIKNPQAVEQQIQVVEDVLEKIEDYAGDGWAVDIEDVAREKSIPELQMMLKRLVEETDKLSKAYTGKPLQEEDLNEGWKQWALGAIAGLTAIGGGAALSGNNTQQAPPEKQGVELVQTKKEKTDKDYYTDATLAHARYNLFYKDKVDKLAETDLGVAYLVKELEHSNFKKLHFDDIALIGRMNQEAIQKVLAIKY